MEKTTTNKWYDEINNIGQILILLIHGYSIVQYNMVSYIAQ